MSGEEFELWLTESSVKCTPDREFLILLVTVLWVAFVIGVMVGLYFGLRGGK